MLGFTLGPCPSSQTPWRPWIMTPQDADPTRTGGEVRLYLPISKRQEYLQSSGEKVLASFPVQATIHFYNDESNSDEEHDQEVQPSDLQHQEAQDGPGGKGRDRLTNPGWHPGGCGGLGGKGPLPYPDSLEDAGCPSSK
ncbi:hypothetical protein EI555_005957 [Monodon monoceros]|uniref:Protein ripply3 n=1 Tax=Monodon monoceros TaxID=40151 RepID=A0A4U1FAW5_MONMO|nr:hypothetical protein EI555_005957 [Monodon monoceros]